MVQGVLIGLLIAQDSFNTLPYKVIAETNVSDEAKMGISNPTREMCLQGGIKLSVGRV